MFQSNYRHGFSFKATSRCLFVAALFFSSIANVYAQSLDELLNEADRALSNPKRGVSDPEAPRPPKKVKRTVPAGDDANRSVAKPAPDTAPSHTAVEPGSLQQVLSIDREVQVASSARQKASLVGIVLGASSFNQNPGYELEKDEDRFEYIDPQRTTGVYLGFESKQPSASLPLDWTYGLNVGLFKGSSKVERKGVEEESTTYNYLMIPASVFLGIGRTIYQHVYLDASAGLALEFINQEGDSDSESVFAVRAGPAMALGATYKMTPSLEATLRYQRHGLANESNGATLSSTQYIGGIRWQVAI